MTKLKMAKCEIAKPIFKSGIFFLYVGVFFGAIIIVSYFLLMRQLEDTSILRNASFIGVLELLYTFLLFYLFGFLFAGIPAFISGVFIEWIRQDNPKYIYLFSPLVGFATTLVFFSLITGGLDPLVYLLIFTGTLSALITTFFLLRFKKTRFYQSNFLFKIVLGTIVLGVGYYLILLLISKLF